MRRAHAARRAPTLAGAWPALCLVVALSACGGGGSSHTASADASTASGADPTHAAFTLGVSGGAYRDVRHVWVTVGSVALHAQADQAWSPADKGWTVLTLKTPVVVDLAVLPSSSQGDVTRVLDGLSVPAGSYGQMRLFPLAHDQALDDAAAAKGLRYNAQVDYSDADGLAQSVPLEMPAPALGWRLAGPFTMAANQASYVVVQADLLHSLVRLQSPDGVDHFSWRPALRSYDMLASGAIIGTIDPRWLCGGASAPAAPQCAQDVVVSAQRLSADGLRHERVRDYRVSSSGGGFALYPLPPDSRYDIVITGRHMQTMVVRDVPVEPFSVVSTLGWTVLSTATAPIVPVITPGTLRTVNLATAMAASGSQVVWGQTLPGGGPPYEVACANLDFQRGVLAQAQDLPQGPLSVASFATDTSTASAASGTLNALPLRFVDTLPAQGSDAFSVWAQGSVYDELGAISVQVPPAGVDSTFTVAEPVRQATLGVGQIAVTVTGSLSSSYDSAQLLVSDVNGVLVSRAVSGGSVVLSVPAGPQAAALGATAVYSVALRATGHGGALSWVRVATAVDLRSSASAAVTLALP